MSVFCFVLNQSAIFKSLKFTKSFNVFRFSKEYCYVLSSANSIVNNFDAFGKSFMRIKKKSWA